MSSGVITDPDDATVCFCHIVAKERILSAIREGADTLEKIQSETLASTGCGGCEYDVRALLDHARGK